MNDEEPKRKYAIPVPIDYRFLEESKKPLVKDELRKIRTNLDELTELKKDLFGEPEIKVEPKVETKSEPKSEIITEIPKQSNEILKITNLDAVPEKDIKIDINNLKGKFDTNLVDNVNKVDKISTNTNIKTENKRIIKRKVNKMNDDDAQQYVSPEEIRKLRKAELQEVQSEDEIKKATFQAKELAEQNKKELENLKKSLSEENSELRKSFANQFSNLGEKVDSKITNLDGKFDGKFGNLDTKLTKTCEGIDCLKNDFATLNKKVSVEMSECPNCHKSVVPPLASFCPNCSAKMYEWTEEDGTPVKGWKPSWESDENKE